MDGREKIPKIRRKCSEAEVKVLIQKVCLQYNSCSVGKGQVCKLRVESRGTFESNAGVTEILLQRMEVGKGKKLPIACRETPS